MTEKVNRLRRKHEIINNQGEKELIVNRQLFFSPEAPKFLFFIAVIKNIRRKLDVC